MSLVLVRSSSSQAGSAARSSPCTSSSVRHSAGPRRTAGTHGCAQGARLWAAGSSRPKRSPHMRSSSALALSLAAALHCSSASAQIRALVVEGETLPDAGVVNGIHCVAVNDSGSWIVQAEIDPGGKFAIVKDGAVLLKEGDELPPGTFHSTDDAVLTNPGESGWVLAVESWWGVYFGEQAVALPLDVCDDASLQPGTTYFVFFAGKMNDARQILASCFQI